MTTWKKEDILSGALKEILIEEGETKWKKEDFTWRKVTRAICRENQEHCTWVFRKVNKEWVFKGHRACYAAQEQAVRTKSIKVKIDKLPVSPKCRLCGTKEEAIMHLVCGFPKLVKKQYKRRHDNVARRVHSELCKKHGLESSDRCWCCPSWKGNMEMDNHWYI